MTARRRKKRSATAKRGDERQVELLPEAIHEEEARASNADTKPAPNDVVPDAFAEPPRVDAAQSSPVAQAPTVHIRAPVVESEVPAPPTPESTGFASRTSAHSDGGADGVRPAGEQLARAKELVAAGQVRSAIDLYLEVLARNPSNLKAHNNLGVLFDELRQHDSALQHFEEAGRIEPENVEVLTNHGSTLSALGRYEQAETVLKRAQRLAPDDADVRLASGILSFRRGMYTQAEAELRWVCERDPKNGIASYYRGEALNRLSRFPEAAAEMERASTLLPNDPRPFYTLGHLFDRRSLPIEAAEMYRRARELVR